MIVTILNEYGEALLGSSQEFGSIFQSEDGIIPHHVQDWRNLKRGASSGVLTLAGGWRRYWPGAPHQQVEKSGHTGHSRAGLEVSGFRNRGLGRDIEASSNQASNLKSED